MTLDELKAEWQKDSYINHNDIGLESIKTSSYHSKYLSELSNHKSRIIQLENKYAIEKKQKIRYYNGVMEKDELEELGLLQYQGKKMLKTDLEVFLSAEPTLQLIDQKIQYTKICINFLENVIKNLYNRNFEIGNFISNKKFEAGFWYENKFFLNRNI